MKRWTVGLAVVVLACASTPAVSAEFQGLGDLPGGLYYSRAEDVSADGLTVVGYSQSTPGGEVEAFRWTQAQGMTDFGPWGEPASRAHAVSADGSVVVGQRGLDVDSVPFVWKSNDRYSIHNPGPNRSATGVSADGSIVVGYTVFAYGHGFRSWPLAVLTGIKYGWGARAYAVSADGQIVVGESYTGAGDDYWSEATYWHSPLVPLPIGSDNKGDPLGRLGGGTSSSAAFAISADGSTIVGESNGQAVTFSRPGTGGVVGLGYLFGYQSSAAKDVSGDGGVIVGWHAGPGGEHAFIWDDTHEMRSLQEVLETDFGLNLSGWVLRRRVKIS